MPAAATKRDHRRKPPAPGVRLLTPGERAAALAGVERMAWHLARKWGLPHGFSADQLDDLAAEVRLGFVEAATRFEPDRGFKFTTYAHWYGKKWATVWLRRELAGGRHVPQYAGYVFDAVASLDAVTVGADGSPMPAAALVADHREADRFPPGWWEAAVAGMPERPRRYVLGRFRDGLTLGDLGAADGVSKEAARQWVEKGLKWLRENRPGLAAELSA